MKKFLALFCLTSIFAATAAAQTIPHVTGTFKTPEGKTPSAAGLKAVATINAVPVYGSIDFQPFDSSGNKPTRILCGGITYIPQRVRGWIAGDGTLVDNYTAAAGVNLVPNAGCTPTGLVTRAFITLAASPDGRVQSITWTEDKTLPSQASVDWGTLAASGVTAPTYTGYATVEDEGAALPARQALNFTGAGVTCTDDALNLRSTCDLSAASGSFTAGGDLSGTSTSQTVIAIRGISVSTTAPTNGQILIFDQPTNKYIPGDPIVSQATASNLNAQVVGNAASASADSGNPVKIGGTFNTTQPTVTTGQRVDAQMSARGEQLVAPGVSGFAVTISGTPTVSISGTPTVTANAGTGNFTVTQSTGTNLHVVCDSGCSSSAGFADNGAFTAGTTAINPVGGLFDDTPPTAITTGHAASARITNNRALHINIRNQAGTELATATNPVRTDPTGTTTQPVSGTVTANLGTLNGVALDATLTGGSLKAQGNAASAASDSGNPLKIGGVFNTTQPTVTTGQRVDAQMTARGEQLVAPGVSGFAVTISGTPTVNATQSGTWTVQPGNTPNTTAWLTTDSSDMSGTTPGTAPSKTGVVGGIFNSAAPTPSTGQTLPLQLDSSGNLKVNVAIGGGTGGTSSSFGAAFPATGTAVGASDGTNMKALLVDASGFLKVNVAAGGGSGGTSSSFGAAIPATGTAAGFSDGTNMQLARVFDGDTGAGTQYVMGALLKKPASGGTVDFGTNTDPVRTDPTGTTTQPVSGTVTANLGTLNGAALDASVTGLEVAQASTTSGQKGILDLGAVTTSAPTYTTAQSSPLSLTTAGALRVDGSGATQPVSGTVTANAGTGNFTVTQSTGTNLHVVCDSGCSSSAGFADNGAFTTGTTAINPVGGLFDDTPPTAITTGHAASARITNNRALHINIRNQAGTELATATNPVRTDPTGTTTQPVSGTVTANIGTSGSLALDASVTGLEVAQASTTSGQKGILAQCAVTTSAPTYTTAQTDPLSCGTGGLLRVDGSGATQPVSGTVTANAGTGTFNIQANASVNEAQVGGSAVSTAATGVQKVGVVGNAGAIFDQAPGSAVPANVLMEGLSDGTNARRALGDATGRQIVKIYPDTTTASYHASANVASAASATDVAVLPGNATNTVLVYRVTVSCSQTTAGLITLQLIKRSTADTAGTSANMTVVPDDSGFSAGSSVPKTYTANPTAGTPVGNVDTAIVGCMATGTAAPNDIYIFKPAKPILLRGVAEQLAVNLNAATVTGGSFDVTFDYAETTTP